MKGNAKCKNSCFEPPFGGLKGNAHGLSMARWKARFDFLLAIIELFSLALTAVALLSEICQNRLFWRGGSLWAQICGRWGSHPQSVCGPLDRGMMSLHLFCWKFLHKKLCSRLFSTEIDFFLKKIAKPRFVPPFGDLGVTYTVHLWLVEKRVVDFLLALIELFSSTLTVEVLWANIGPNCAVWKGVGHFERKFQGEGGLSTNEFWHPKLEFLGYHVVLFAWSIAVLIQYRRVTHRHTDTRWWLLPAHRLRRAGQKRQTAFMCLHRGNGNNWINAFCVYYL